MDGLKSRGHFQSFGQALNQTLRQAFWQTIKPSLLSVALVIIGMFVMPNSPVSLLAKEPVPTQTAIYDSFVAAQRQDAELHSLFPLSSDRVWAVGERGLILASEDGGIHWKQQESGTTCSLRDIYFVDPLRGWAVGFAVQPFSRRSYGVVLNTTDGGKKWNYVPQHLLPPLHGIRRTEAGNLITWGGWSTQLGSSVFESLDAGRSWSPSPNVTSEYENIVPLLDGWVGNTKNGPVIHWALHQVLPVNKLRKWKLFQCDGDRLIGIDNAHQLLTGSLADQSTLQKVLPPHFLTTIDALACHKQVLFASGKPGKTIARSEDFGMTWQPIETPVSASLKQFTFLDENRGWAISELGDIVATRDGGKSWWVQRTGFSQLGILFIVADNERIPWTSLTFCATELQRSTGLLVITDSAERTFEDSQNHRRIEAAASSIGVNFVKFLSNEEFAKGNETELPNSGQGTLTSVDIVATVQQYAPEVIVVGNGTHPSGNSAKDYVLRAVLERAQSMKDQNHNFAQKAAQSKVHKVYSVSHSKARSLEMTGSHVLKRSGKLLGDVTQRATTLIEEQVDLEHPESLLLIYAENPGDGTATDIGSGFLPSPETTRQIELGHQGNLQVVLGSTARRKSLQRLVDSSRRDSRDESWDDYFKQVVDSLTRDELEISLIWLADRLREQGKWLQWQMVAETLIRRQPDGGAAEVMWRQLLVVAASYELNHWRDNELKSAVNSNLSAGVVTASANGSDTPPTSPFAMKASQLDPIPSPNHSSLGTGETRETTSDSNKQPTNQALMQWIGEQLPLRHPMLVGEPDVLFQFSSWYRRHSVQSPLIAEVQNGLRLLSMQSYPEAWQNAAAIESSLWNSTGTAVSSGSQPTATASSKPNLGRNLITIAQSIDRPLLDGLSHDHCWQQSQSITLANKTPHFPQPGTEVRIAFDEEWLFVWICCERDTSAKRSAPATRREYDSDLSHEDRVRLTLDIDRDRITTVQFEVDQRGLTRDTCWGLTQWNPRWFVAQHHTDSHWMSEFAIPLSDLCANNRVAGTQWCVGIERHSGERALGHWPQSRGPLLRPIDLGILQFTTAPVVQPATIR
jgi:photosystem II stability/assembly factor-like uncharacterized protein